MHFPAQSLPGEVFLRPAATLFVRTNRTESGQHKGCANEARPENLSCKCRQAIRE
jgi:hypothetical protein